MKKVLFLILFAPFGFSANLDLVCEGYATVTNSKVSSSTANVYGGGNAVYGSGSTVTSSDNQVEAEIIFHLKDGFEEGYIQLPSVMRPPIGGRKKDKFELKDISVTDSEIKASFKINGLNKPKITISRITGRMEYKAFASPKNFSGDCSVLDITEKKF
tara:strand:- start:86 stop:559 length:474 start_codon:yes stop_codon:yes gene_type:complete